MSKMRLLTEEEIRGNKKLDIFNKYKKGVECTSTDFADILGSNHGTDYWLKADFFDTIYNKGFTPSWIVGGDGSFYFSNLIPNTSGLRPVISYNSLDLFQNIIIDEHDGVKIGEYGEYPQTDSLEPIVEIEVKKKLLKMLKEDQLEKTGKTYTVCELQKDEYIFKHFTEFIFNDNKCIYYKNFLVMVEPIKWLIDEKNKLAIAKDVLFYGIPYSIHRGSNDKYYTNINDFINRIFVKEIIPSNIIKNEIVSIDNESKVNILVKDIRNIIKGKSYEESITVELNNLIEEYNNKLRNDNNLLIDNEPTNLIVNKMENELERILDILNKFNSKGNIYYDMLEYLDRLINIRNEKKIKDLDSFSNDIYLLVNQSIEFLSEDKKNKYYNELINIFNNEKNKIEKYIENQISLNPSNNQDIKLEYNSKEELINYLRDKIHPLLQIITKEVEQYDIKKSIDDSISDIIKFNYQISNNKMVNLYLNQINESYSKIMAYLNDNKYISEEQKISYINLINNIMENEIDYQQKIDIILNELKKRWLSLNKILYEIEDYVTEKEYVDFNIIVR